MTYAARPRHPVTGQRFYLRGQTQRELEAYLHRLDSLRTELKLGVRTPEEIDRELRHLKHGPITLERAARAYLERPGLAANTRRGIRSMLAGHMAEIAAEPLASLDAVRVAAWLEQLARRGLAASSVAAAWRKLSAIGAYAGERGWIGAVPWGSYKPKRIGGPGRARREAARTAAELVALFEAAQSLDAEPGRYTGLACKILIAALLGLRQGELAGLRWSDLEWGPPLVVTIARQWDGQALKTKRVARLEAMNDVRIQLIGHRQAMRAQRLFAERGPVFPVPSSLPGSPRAYAHGEVITRLQLRSAVEGAKLPYGRSLGAWSAHGLRDTFVTLEVSAAGGDLASVQARTRHASLASLARYVRRLDRNIPPPPGLRSLPPGTDSDDADDEGTPSLSLLNPQPKRTGG